MPRNRPVYLQFFRLCHRLKRRETTPFDSVESQNFADPIEVAYNLVAAADALGNNASEGLPEEAWAMADKGKPVEEYLHDGGDLERVVRRCEDHAIRRHHFLDEHIPVILQGTELLTLLKAQLTTSTSSKLIIAEGDDLALNIT